MTPSDTKHVYGEKILRRNKSTYVHEEGFPALNCVYTRVPEEIPIRAQIFLGSFLCFSNQNMYESTLLSNRPKLRLFSVKPTLAIH